MAAKPTQAPRSGGRATGKCQDMIRRALQTPKAKLLMEHMEKAGCGVGENFFKGVHCTRKNSGYYLRGRGIQVCCNHMRFQDDVNQVIIHELIHAYDECRAKNMDWSNCAHVACSEIRAAHLSGDCHFMRELLRGQFKIKGHEPECVKRRVMKATMFHPNCSETIAKYAMETVWDICYNDMEPFDKAP